MGFKLHAFGAKAFKGEGRRLVGFAIIILGPHLAFWAEMPHAIGSIDALSVIHSPSLPIRLI